ncbi:hypothetical protein VU04_11880 [Desulfobulbus sp. TB]|nr:hypothetical protein [Desulfobulbus sp. TB]
MRANHQPAALIYWPLELSINEIRHCAAMAQDRNYEIGEMHFVPFKRDSIIEFVLQQESHAPIATWVIALSIFSLGAGGVKNY